VSETVENESFRANIEFFKPLTHDGKDGLQGKFTVSLENLTSNLKQNLVLHEKTFKLYTKPFQLAGHEKCRITFNIHVPRDFQFSSSSLQLELVEALPPVYVEHYPNGVVPERIGP